MNDSLIRKFCESRYRFPITLTATILLGLATLLPQVDDYIDKRSGRNTLSEELVQARQTAKTLPEFEQRVGKVVERLSGFESRAIDEAGLASYRSRLVDMVRASGCQIRRIDVAAPSTRPWKVGDEPLAESSTATGAATPFVLERRSVSLAVDGSMGDVHNLLDRLEKERTLAHAHRVQLQPTVGAGSEVTLELELWLFALTRTAQSAG